MWQLSKLHCDTTRKRTTNKFSLWTIMQKILNKMLAHCSKTHPIDHDQVYFIPETQGLFNMFNMHKPMNGFCYVWRMKNENKVITSLDVENSFEETPNLFKKEV